MTDQEIKQLLDDKLKNVVNNIFNNPSATERYNRQRPIMDLLVSETLRRLDEDGRLPVFYFQGMLHVIDDLDLDLLYAGELFSEIEQSIANKVREDIKENAVHNSHIRTAIGMLKIDAHAYFRVKFYQELKDCNTVKKLRAVKLTISDINQNWEGRERTIFEDTFGDRFRLSALAEMQTSLEQTIAEKREDEELNQLFKEFESPIAAAIQVDKEEVGEKKGDREERQKELGLTIERAFLAINYLLVLNRASCTNTKKAEFISFLTGYSKNTIVQEFSKFNNEKGKINDDEEINEKFYKDMNEVRKFFNQLGLGEIVKMIDNDLGEKSLKS